MHIRKGCGMLRAWVGVFVVIWARPSQAREHPPIPFAVDNGAGCARVRASSLLPEIALAVSARSPCRPSGAFCCPNYPRTTIRVLLNPRQRPSQLDSVSTESIERETPSPPPVTCRPTNTRHYKNSHYIKPQAKFSAQSFYISAVVGCNFPYFSLCFAAVFLVF